MPQWKRNVLVYKIDSIINWFFIPIGTYILIWSSDLNLSFSKIAFAISTGLFLSVILELPSGALADLFGRRTVIIIGRATLVLAYVIFFLQRNYIGVLIHQLLYYVDASSNSGAQSALLYDSLKENGLEKKLYQKVEADTFLLCTIGMAIASILGGYLYKINPYLPFSIMIPMTLIGLITATFYIEPKLDTQKYSLKDYVNQNIEGAKHIFRNGLVKWVSIFSIISTVITYVSLWYLYEARITNSFSDSGTIAWIVAGTYIVRAIGTRFVGKFEKLFKAKGSPIALILFQSLGSFLSFFKNSFGAISSVYFRKFSDGFRTPIVLNMQNEQIESKYRATALSAVSLIGNLAMIPLGYLAGVGIEKFGVENTLGFVGILSLLIGMPVAIKLSRLKN